MKTTKILTILIFSVLFAITLNGCKKCKDEDPRGRIINNGTQKQVFRLKHLVEIL